MWSTIRAIWMYREPHVWRYARSWSDLVHRIHNLKLDIDDGIYD